MSFSKDRNQNYNNYLTTTLERLEQLLERDMASSFFHDYDEDIFFSGKRKSRSLPFTSVDNTSDSFFQTSYHPLSLLSSLSFPEPAANVYENDKSWLICAEMPGVKKEDIKVDIQSHFITISGEIKFDKEFIDSGNVNILRELGQGAFKRSLQLPDNVDHSKISAKFENGILRVDLPKTKETKTSRNISVE